MEKILVTELITGDDFEVSITIPFDRAIIKSQFKNELDSILNREVYIDDVYGRIDLLSNNDGIYGVSLVHSMDFRMTDKAFQKYKSEINDALNDFIEIHGSYDAVSADQQYS